MCFRCLENDEIINEMRGASSDGDVEAMSEIVEEIAIRLTEICDELPHHMKIMGIMENINKLIDDAPFTS